MNQEPLFDLAGKRPEDAHRSFSGKADNPMMRPARPGETRTFVVRTKCAGVAFKENTFGVLDVVESHKVAVAFELDDAEANDLLERLADRDAKATGQDVLPFPTPADPDGQVPSDG